MSDEVKRDRSRRCPTSLAYFARWAALHGSLRQARLLKCAACAGRQVAPPPADLDLVEPDVIVEEGG